MKTMKKWRKLRIAFWVAALAVLIGWNAGAVKEVRAESYEGYEYSVKDDGTVSITGYSGNERELVIPGEIEGKRVDEIGNDAFSGRRDLTGITIPEGVTSIGGDAFVIAVD